MSVDGNWVSPWVNVSVVVRVLREFDKETGGCYPSIYIIRLFIYFKDEKNEKYSYIQAQYESASYALYKF